MRLTELFYMLSTGELSQVFLSGSERDTIEGDKQKVIALSIQLGLTALHKRFNIRNEDTFIELVADTNTYKVPVDNLIKIEKLSTLSGWEIPLNNAEKKHSCHTPLVDTIVVPDIILNKSEATPEYLKKVESIKVRYKADHPKFIPRIGPINADKVEIQLPDTYTQALLYFVASRTTNPQGMTNEFHTGNSWFQKYELECQRLEVEGTAITEDLSHSRFRKNGWC